ncbi:GNAT family N-acetyltransferase [Streptosporangium lutulentum]|uniref:GNAT family N-acetyltransferase n=1 Tax=Streptosporangium lutulentum TaxID=1461250 RepID=UPI0027D7C0F3|nr:GNAT family N-acetyltransferase [Streptosporangium lutulentum]
MTVVEVPQWQGSGSATAVRLAEGAALLGDMIPEAERVRIQVAGTLKETAERTRTALDRVRDGLVVTVGGDCGVELEPIAAALRRYGERLTVIWFDAHADLNTPDSSPSGAFHGMVLRTLLGDGPPELVPDQVLRPEQVVLAGVRALDAAESDFARATGIAGRSAPGEKTAALYIHIDLDVLDPDVFGSVGAPEPGGTLPQELVEQVAALAERFEIVGLGVTEYEPARRQDHDLLATLVPELVGLCRVSKARQVERRAARVWPASNLEEHEGWLLRHTPGVKRKRWNSALPPLHRATGVDRVEEFYRERETPLRVQVSPAEHHRDLDALLAARGYRIEGETSVLTASTGEVIAATAPAATVETVTDRGEWPRIFADLDDHLDSAAVGGTVLPHTVEPAALLTVSDGGRVAGMALFVADEGWAGIFSMATRPEYRRRGVATALLGAGARWAAEQGAERLYLQVEQDNKTARRLYARVGFVRSHTYHYRTRP